MLTRSSFLIALILCVCCAGCGKLPRDPEETLSRVQQSKRLRVGLVEHPPWVVRTAGEPSGAEVELVKQFASDVGATPEWQLEKLGLAPTDVKLRTEKHVMAAPPGENGLIKRLDEFLYRRRGDVKSLLEQQQQQEARR